MAKILPVTPSLLNKFMLCPKQYEATYITKESQYQETAVTKHGITLHKAIEAYIVTQGMSAFPPEVAYGLPYAQWALSEGRKEQVELRVEEAIAMTHDFKPTGWFGPAWMRGKVDLAIVDHLNKHVALVDWKTGKPRDETTQAQILSLCAAATYGYQDITCLWVNIHPSSENSTKGLPKVVHHKIKVAQPYTEFNPLFIDIAKYTTACKADNFTPTPNPLCKDYCDVKSCPHNPNYRGK